MGKEVMIIILAIVCCGSLKAQSNEHDRRILADIMEYLIENRDAGMDYTDLQEQLELRLRNKIDLNKSSREDYAALHFLNPSEIETIIAHREKMGDYMDKMELQNLDIRDQKKILWLSLFVEVSAARSTPRVSWAKMILKGRHELVLLEEMHMQRRKGFEKDSSGLALYTGTPFRSAIRYRFNSEADLSFGFSLENDIGEPYLLSANQLFFDFSSFHFCFSPASKHLKTIVLGDFQANFGQGLTFASGMAGGKSAYVLDVSRNFRDLRPYRSLNENEFLRGIGLLLGAGRSEIVLFVSHKAISAGLTGGDEDTGDGSFSSIRLSGLHRTVDEREGRLAVKQSIAGFHLKKPLYASHKFKSLLGVTLVHTSYSKAFEPGSKPYQHYSFRGDQLTNAGIDCMISLRNLSLSGELATNSGSAYAFTGNLVAALDPKLDLALLFRHFDPAYQSTFTSPFSEFSDTRNETGYYAGVVIRPAKAWTLNVYFDMYRSPWMRFSTDGPSAGTDFLGELQYTPNKTDQFAIRFRHEEKERNQSGDAGLFDYLSRSIKSTWRVNYQYQLIENMTGRSRIECSSYRDDLQGPFSGLLIFQDLSLKSVSARLSLTARLALFQIDHFNTRIYATQRDVLYQYAVPSYGQSGTGYYFIIHYKMSRHAELWIKYNETIYADVSSIGSGAQEIKGNIQSDLRVQLRISL